MKKILTLVILTITVLSTVAQTQETESTVKVAGITVPGKTLLELENSTIIVFTMESLEGSMDIYVYNDTHNNVKACVKQKILKTKNTDADMFVFITIKPGLSNLWEYKDNGQKFVYENLKQIDKKTGQETTSQDKMIIIEENFVATN